MKNLEGNMQINYLGITSKRIYTQEDLSPQKITIKKKYLDEYVFNGNRITYIEKFLWSAVGRDCYQVSSHLYLLMRLKHGY